MQMIQQYSQELGWKEHWEHLAQYYKEDQLKINYQKNYGICQKTQEPLLEDRWSQD